jgi:hypothetical protein
VLFNKEIQLSLGFPKFISSTISCGGHCDSSGNQGKREAYEREQKSVEREGMRSAWATTFICHSYSLLQKPQETQLSIYTLRNVFANIGHVLKPWRTVLSSVFMKYWDLNSRPCSC